MVYGLIVINQQIYCAEDILVEEIVVLIINMLVSQDDAFLLRFVILDIQFFLDLLECDLVVEEELF